MLNLWLKTLKKHNCFVKKMYHSCFGVKLGGQDKQRAPHKVYVCVENLESSQQVITKQSFRFIFWWYGEDLKIITVLVIFCSCDVKVYKSKDKKVILLPNKYILSVTTCDMRSLTGYVLNYYQTNTSWQGCHLWYNRLHKLCTK